MSVRPKFGNVFYRRFLRPLVFTSRLGRKVIMGHVGKGSFVDYIYQNRPSGYKGPGSLVDSFLLRLPASKATREKFQMICAILEGEITKNIQANRVTRIVDLGSGTSRYLLELTDRVQRRDLIQALCLDVDPHSLSYARRIANGYPIEYRLGNIAKLRHYFRLAEKTGWRPNIALVSTCYDFLDDGVVRRSLDETYRQLDSGGLLVVVSQSRNPSQGLIDQLKAGNGSFQIHYRSQDLLKKWMVEAGFKDIHIQIDKWGMYYFCIGKKLGTQITTEVTRPIFEKSLSYKRASEQRSQNIYQYMRGFKPVHSSKAGEGRLVMLATNDYLGLRTRPEIVEAAKKAIEEYGTSTTSSRILTGNLDIHEELQEKLAQFLNVEDALIFSAGYMANLGVISELVGEGDVAFIDRSAHASILDGCRLSRGHARFFAHNNLENLGRLLKEYEGTKGKLIICDGVYSMEGDLAPLPEIFSLAEKYSVGIAIDDGHATGIFGEHGRGTIEHFHLDGTGFLILGSLGKALASVGGFVAGAHAIVDHLRHTARPLIFSTGLSPSSVAAAIEALRIIQDEPWLVHRLWSNTRRMKEGLKALGYNVGQSSSPLIPVIIGDEFLVYRMVLALEGVGVIIDGVGPPGVKKDQCRLRIRMSATHTDEEINLALKELERVGKEFRVI